MRCPSQKHSHRHGTHRVPSILNLYLALADGVCVRDGDRDRVGDRDEVRDAVPETLGRGLRVGDLLAVRVAVGVRLLVWGPEGLRDGVCSGVQVRDGVIVDGSVDSDVGAGDGVSGTAADADTVLDGVAGRVGVPVSVAAALADGVPVAACVRVPLFELVRVPVSVRVWLGVTADEALNEPELDPELLADALEVPLGGGDCDVALVAVFDSDAELVPVALPGCDGERDRLPLRVPVCVGRAVSLADPEADAEADGDAVADAVSEGVREPVAEPVSVRVPVGVGVDHSSTLETAISEYGLHRGVDIGIELCGTTHPPSTRFAATKPGVSPWVPNVPRDKVARRVSL